MQNVQNIGLVMDAINDVKVRAKEAAKQGDFIRYKELMADLLALENCLATEVSKGLKAA